MYLREGIIHLQKSLGEPENRERVGAGRAENFGVKKNSEFLLHLSLIL